MNNNGFVSTTVLYSLLILFLFLVLSITKSYINKNNYENIIVSQAKEELKYVYIEEE